MGNRISIQFGKAKATKKEQLSVVLTHHWAGPKLIIVAKDFIRNKAHFDPDKAMVAFIQKFKNSDNIRLLPKQDYCYNSDNGHFIIWIDNLDRKNIKTIKAFR